MTFTWSVLGNCVARKLS